MSKQTLKQRKALRSAAAKKGWETRRNQWPRFRVEMMYSPPVYTPPRLPFVSFGQSLLVSDAPYAFWLGKDAA